MQAAVGAESLAWYFLKPPAGLRWTATSIEFVQASAFSTDALKSDCVKLMAGFKQPVWTSRMQSVLLLEPSGGGGRCRCGGKSCGRNISAFASAGGSNHAAQGMRPQLKGRVQ